MDDYLPYAGYVQFPRRPDDLASGVCPACFAARTAARCPACGLDLANPAIAELDATGRDAAAALDRRLQLIGRIRYETAAAAASVAPVAPPAPVSLPAAIAQPVAVPQPEPVPRPAAPAAAALPAPPAPPRRHLGVQVILLIVGVSLISVGAVFFLVYAFINFGLVARSLIIGAVTVAAFVTASLLRRRRLGVTAEAISALAVVFVYLDAFAIRANDLFSAGSADGLVYWGIALLAAAAGFAVWHRFSGLRLPSIVAAVTVAPALALLVGGLSTGLDDGVRVFAALLSLAAGALVHPFFRGRAVERVTCLVIAAVGIVSSAFVSLFVQLSVDWAPIVTFGLVALVACAHVVVLLRLGVSRVFAAVIACLGSVVAASTFAAVAARTGEPGFAALVPLVAAAIVALGLELVARRTAASAAVAAAWSAAGVAGIILLVTAGGALLRALLTVSLGARRWSLPGGAPLDVPVDGVLGIVAIAAVIALAAAAWAVGRALPARRLIVAYAGLGMLVLAVPLTGRLWAAVLGWLLLAAASTALLIVGRRRGWGPGIRIALLATGLACLAFAYSASWASIDTWWYASAAAVALLVAARAATALAPVRAALLGAASVVALVTAGAGAWHASELVHGASGAGFDSLHAVCLLAILLVGIAALLRRTASHWEARVVLWLSLATTVVTGGISWPVRLVSSHLLFPEPATSAVLGLLLIGALLPWVLQRGNGFDAERIAASIVLAPAAAWLFDSTARLVPLPDFAASLAPVAAAVVVAAISLATGGPRWARDAGAGLVAAIALLFALVAGGDSAWLVLLLSAAVALLVALSRDGLFGSASPRKHLGWLALALAFGGLARRLTDYGVHDLAPYVLPLTGALLLVALGAWRARRTSPVPAFIALAALLVSIVPLGVESANGDLRQSIVVATASALLLLVGTTLHGSPYFDVAAAAGATGVLVAGFARPIALAVQQSTADPELDIWLAVSTGALLLAGVAQARHAESIRTTVGEAVLSAALVVAAVVEISALGVDGTGTVRALVVMTLLAGIHLVGMLLDRPPFSTVMAWMALGLAAVTGIAGVIVAALDPIEWATGIVAAPLLIVGAVTLRRRPGASSWPWAAPGLLVLLLPSLLATFGDQPAWRLVGLGAACVAAIVIGALAKLQAPLLIGTVLVLVHAIRTFSPQLAAVYQLTEWWVWAVIGGAIIIFVAVTFERRMRDLKSIGGRIAALR